MESTENGAHCKIIEDNAQKARKLAEVLNRSSVVSGEMMSDVILDEAGFDSADISIAVTDRDKDNLLISLLAAKNRDAQAVSLVNSRDYTVLAANIRNNVIVDRAVITISGILKYLRKARIEEAYAIGRDLGEIWEIRLGEDSSNIGKSIAELNIPTESSVMLILSGDRLIYDFKTYRLTAQDKIVIYVTPTDIRRIEKIFYL
jgi:trk system potassium uptake protein TrkA